MNKLKGAAITFASLTLIAMPLIAAAPVAPGDTVAFRLAPESSVWVEGTSTVQSYRCEAGSLDASITPGDARASTLVELGSAVRQVELRVPVAGLECGNRTMNGHMRNALKSDSHPVVRFRITNHAISQNGDVRMEGRLSIAGRERPVTINARATQAGSGRFRIRGESRLVMTDYGVEPPRLMMGTLRVHDPVLVGFDMVLQP